MDYLAGMLSGVALPTPAVGTIPVDRASPVPLYLQVAQHLERAIESGLLTMERSASGHDFEAALAATGFTPLPLGRASS
jgi:hypothetical protein